MRTVQQLACVVLQQVDCWSAQGSKRGKQAGRQAGKYLCTLQLSLLQLADVHMCTVDATSYHIGPTHLIVPSARIAVWLVYLHGLLVATTHLLSAITNSSSNTCWWWRC